MAPGEFDIIARWFSRGTNRGDVALGVGDDAALLAPRAGMRIAVAVDTLVGGVHFDVATPAAAVGHKCLAVNLSDLAAMGAEPAAALLALTLPAADAHWIEAFAGGLFALADRYSVALIGGDTTRGPLCISVTVLGYVAPGRELRRAGARPGEAIYVTGTPGEAALGLALAQGRIDLSPVLGALAIERLHQPQPRVATGMALRGVASAAIDISDGLCADLGHLLAASGVGAEIDADALPLSPALRAVTPRTRALEFALAGGDDYELLFTAPPEAVDAAKAALDAAGVPITRIGTVRAQPGLVVSGADDSGARLGAGGFRHF
ncbi:MAG: thiamine-phosphate kinase [Gammaproteobacteria bacterium]